VSAIKHNIHSLAVIHGSVDAIRCMNQSIAFNEMRFVSTRILLSIIVFLLFFDFVVVLENLL
jgi:hypothetical protein